MTALVQLEPLRRTVELTIDDEKVQVPEGITIFEACRQRGTAIPTLCYLETLHPKSIAMGLDRVRAVHAPAAAFTGLNIRSCYHKNSQK